MDMIGNCLRQKVKVLSMQSTVLMKSTADRKMLLCVIAMLCCCQCTDGGYFGMVQSECLRMGMPAHQPSYAAFQCTFYPALHCCSPATNECDEKLVRRLPHCDAPETGREGACYL